MDIQKTYKKVLDDLIKGIRPLLTLAKKDIEVLQQGLVNASSKEEFIPILCILDNSRTLSSDFSDGILKILQTETDPELLIMGLGVARKHIIEARHKDGHRMEGEFLETLKNLLEHSDYEVREWVLRLIEGLGSQSLYFKEKVLSIKPKITLFNEHKKMTKEIIELLEKRWKVR